MSALAFANMEASFEHAPVLLDAVVDYVGRAKGASGRRRLVVDGTVGGAGHACAILDAFADVDLIGIDRDTDALTASRTRLAPYGERAELLHGRFSEMESLLAARGDNRISADAILVDLGVSSFQLDTAARGFSFRQHGPLDMRMDRSAGQNAREMLARMSEDRLTDVIRTLGEERHARRVARRILQVQPQDTATLAQLVRDVVPPSRDRIDPATRTFQAIRMLVNEETEELSALLAALPRLLAPGGVAILISFHSLEDRAVKNALRDGAKGCICPPSLPVCGCGLTPVYELFTRRPVRAGDIEIADNPRSRSAKLRAARRIEVAP